MCGLLDNLMCALQNLGDSKSKEGVQWGKCISQISLTWAHWVYVFKCVLTQYKKDDLYFLIMSFQTFFSSILLNFGILKQTTKMKLVKFQTLGNLWQYVIYSITASKKLNHSFLKK